MTQKESDNLKLAVISAVSRDSVFSEDRRGDTSFSALLGSFVHLDCPEDIAARHWKLIMDRRDSLSGVLGRSVSLYTAIADYCAEPGGPLEDPFMVEGPAFRDTVRQAMVDGLTGVFNRRYMDITLRKEYNRCERWGKSLSLCMIDIDDFKIINDTKGHPFGDKVLVRLASIIKNSLREEDVLCRYGGEEFLMVLPETDAAGAMVLAKRLYAATKQDTFLTMSHVTFSAGLATYPEIKTADGLLAAADKALYQAKYNGKDQIVPAMPLREPLEQLAAAGDRS